MHVGLVIYGRLDRKSGGYLYDRKLVQHLRAAGETVTVFSMKDAAYPAALLQNMDFRFQRRLLAADLDVLLQDELNHPSLFAMNRMLADRLTCPIVAVVHNLRSSMPHPAWENLFYRRVERCFLKSVDTVICNSHTTHRSVEALLGRSVDGLVARPSGRRFGKGVDRRCIRERAHQEGPLRLLFLGNVIPGKRLHDVLAALEQLPPHSWMLDVAGSLTARPAYVRRIERLIDRMDGGQVALHGHLKEGPLTDLLRRAHVLVLPSAYEGYGIAYVEAKGFGLPALATSAGAAAEVVAEGRDGFLVDPGDIDSLADRIRRLQQDRSQLAAMGEAALASFQEGPTWQDTGARIRRFLISLTGDGHD